MKSLSQVKHRSAKSIVFKALGSPFDTPESFLVGNSICSNDTVHVPKDSILQTIDLLDCRTGR